MRHGARSFFAFAAGAALLVTVSRANADPQISGALTTGAALTDFRASNGPRVAYHLGGRFDALFLRDRADQMALGPYVEVLTEAFDTFETGGGASWLVPVGEPAFVLSAGGFARESRFGWNPGVVGALFFGSRSFNYHSVYGLSAGLLVEGRYGFGDGKQADVVIGAQLDLELLALPALLVFEAIAR